VALLARSVSGFALLLRTNGNLARVMDNEEARKKDEEARKKDEVARKKCEDKGNEYVQLGFKASSPVKTSMKHAPKNTVKVILGPGDGIVVVDGFDHHASTHVVNVIEARGKPCFAHNDAWVIFITQGN